MNIRTAKLEDGAAVRAVARRSLETSYSLSPQAIESAVTQWYNEEELTNKLEESEYVVLVAERGETIAGFAEGVVVESGGDGDLLWLHVDPDYRGNGVGERLYDAIYDRLMTMGAARLRGRVLRDNHSGNDFYEQHDLVKAGDEHVDIDGTQYVENIYVEDELTDIETITSENGGVHIDYDDAERGSVAPFFAAYNDTERTNRYGYFCSNCDSLDIAMDAMGRAECNQCGNQRKATRWDAAYL
ncbi:GNAT family N-acetyltransferase [Halocatena pleomorpha]|uniref:GNAT family N-acetyltransferase n=1 Tax=Halocatena pleomorpha TaxID=1785090 RepID=A0A3P3RH33_9EURY|nr:GNAT family N-acetyltransferase [Halocatena pleomorpha]RRJ32846.1 GNAT family N-acetyltransferase [Halocatena pleomorpha]